MINPLSSMITPYIFNVVIATTVIVCAVAWLVHFLAKARAHRRRMQQMDDMRSRYAQERAAARDAAAMVRLTRDEYAPLRRFNNGALRCRHCGVLLATEKAARSHTCAPTVPPPLDYYTGHLDSAPSSSDPDTRP